MHRTKGGFVRHSRKGFTLLELLAVIGIILILISMAIIGYQQIDKAATARATKATLANAQALLAEYEINTPLNTIIDRNGNSVVPTTGLALAPVVGAPGDVNPTTDPNAPRYGSAVTYTQSIMLILTRVPKNKQVVSQLPARSMLNDPNGNPYTGTTGPVLLDGWKNPIIFVPASGLVVNLAHGPGSANGGPTSTQFTVRTSGVYAAGSVPAVSVADRPFFASAGQDGNFTNGDDNLYSFQP
jgi:prepilin-type N-terminal cleavage/methylation domain-containing protein